MNAEVPTASVTACTAATVAQLPAVRVLLKSFLDHHPGARFHVLLVDSDDPTGVAVPEGPVEFLHPSVIGVDDEQLARLRTAYRSDELGAVLRPTLMRWLVAATDTSGPVLYLDPAVLILGSIIEPVLDGLVEPGGGGQQAAGRKKHSVVLLPRVLKPLPEDNRRPDAADLHTEGLFDPALIAVNRGAEDFLRAWSDNTLHSQDGAFLDGASVLVDHHVLRDPGIGLSVFNAGQRALRADENGAVTVDGAPLRSVHFAGFDPTRPWLLSAGYADRPRVLLSEHRLLARLCAGYVAALSSAVDSGEPAAIEQRIGSARPPAALRAAYRAAWQAADRDGELPPPPWIGAGAEFAEWAFAQVDAHPVSTRWATALWHDDPDLRRRFPHPLDADAAAFREWCAGVGVPSGVLPADAVPPAPDDTAPLTDQLGVSVLGTGRVATLIRAAATASGLPVSDRPDYPVLLCCEPAALPPALADARYIVAVPSTPSDLSAFPGVDEVWSLSNAGKAGLDGVTKSAVHAMTLPILDAGERDVPAMEEARQKLGWPTATDADPVDLIVFAGIADHAYERVDNALGSVAAFRAAFPGTEDVRLVLLLSGVADHPEIAERLRLAVAFDDRIRLVEDPEPAERALWLDTANCLVSLHRDDHSGHDHSGAERVMLTLAEPAARGIPLVCAEYGAAAELLAAGGALLVSGGIGAVEADSTAAVEALRAAASDIDAAEQLGRLGRLELLRTHAVGVAGEQLRNRVEQAYHAWRARRSAERPEPLSDPLRPLRSARHVLLREPDVGASHKVPMAPALRKAVLRVLNHYDVHLRSMLGTLMDGVERTSEELLRRQDAAAGGEPAEVAMLRDRLDRLTERTSRLDEAQSGTDDGVLRARADIAGQSRRLDELEDAVVGEAGKRGKHLQIIADRLDRLTEALDRTLDRIDELESRTGAVLDEQQGRSQVTVRAASQALRASDALRRVVLREYERRAEQEPPDSALAAAASSLVLCDAGLLRLPADDGVMLPLLSSNGVWEPELSTLIDSLVEPGGIFVDIGAYVGYHTLRVLSRLGTSGAVVAVEPHTEATVLLRHNISMNVAEAVGERLTVIEAAAWDSPGTLRTEPAMTGGFAVFPGEPDPESTSGASQAASSSTSSATSSATSSGRSEEPTEETRPADSVPAVRLDRELEAVTALQGMPLSVVKVDAPGRGHRALGGLVRLLRRDRPNVFCAFSASQTSAVGDDPTAVLREFDTWGFDVVLLGDDQPATPAEVIERADGQHSITLWLRPRSRTTQ
ncbi:MAG TPA: FkbM family methyltransferase [Pseudonocardiaceae bacterium]|nr:FkbM family methyltransferase [Pseudonocardiaceae bacterium]